MNLPTPDASRPTLPEDAIATQLRQLGPGFNLPEVRALYEPLLARQPRDGVTLHANLQYGTHHRQHVDVYLPGGTGQDRPVLVWLHGGGFIRGDKNSRANIGWWGAREGFVVVLPNYRLAPECGWPSGPTDVVVLWNWLQAEAERFGGDPQGIVLAGESAGAAHVAAAVLMRRFHPPSWGPAGAVLMSGPYNAHLEGVAHAALGIPMPDPRNEAYFGPDRTSWREASIVEHIDADPLPLWISYAERDLLQMQVQACELFARLVTLHGFHPELRMVREHNHFSSGYSIGTDDMSVSSPLKSFIRRCKRHAGNPTK